MVELFRLQVVKINTVELQEIHELVSTQNLS